MTGLEQLVTTIGAVAGICTALGIIVWAVRTVAGGIRRAVHTLDAIETIVDKELTHNHGTSIKDDITGLAASIGTLQRVVGDIDTRVDTLAALSAKHHPDDGWQLFKKEGD